MLLSSKCLSPISFLRAIRTSSGGIFNGYRRHYEPFCSATVTISEFETLFPFIVFTFENRYDLYMYIAVSLLSVEALLNLFRLAKKSTNIS